MEFYDELKQRLADVQNTDNNIRQNAESQVENLRDQNPVSIISLCSRYLILQILRLACDSPNQIWLKCDTAFLLLIWQAK